MTLSVFPTANVFVLFCAADVRDYLTHGKINEFCLVLEPLVRIRPNENLHSINENVNFSYQSTQYPYTSPQSTYIMEPWFCNKNLNGTNYTERNNDICSHYILGDSEMCKVSIVIYSNLFLHSNSNYSSYSTQLQLNQFQVSSDRGTPLVCNNQLTGLLSQIIPPKNESSPAATCESTLKTWAYFTKVSTYTEWIHQTIGRLQPTAAPGQIPPQQPTATPPPYYSKYTTGRHI